MKITLPFAFFLIVACELKRPSDAGEENAKPGKMESIPEVNTNRPPEIKLEAEGNVNVLHPTGDPIRQTLDEEGNIPVFSITVIDPDGPSGKCQENIKYKIGKNFGNVENISVYGQWPNCKLKLVPKKDALGYAGDFPLSVWATDGISAGTPQFATLIAPLTFTSITIPSSFRQTLKGELVQKIIYDFVFHRTFDSTKICVAELIEDHSTDNFDYKSGMVFPIRSLNQTTEMDIFESYFDKIYFRIASAIGLIRGSERILGVYDTFSLDKTFSVNIPLKKARFDCPRGTYEQYEVTAVDIDYYSDPEKTQKICALKKGTWARGLIYETIKISPLPTVEEVIEQLNGANKETAAPPFSVTLRAQPACGSTSTALFEKPVTQEVVNFPKFKDSKKLKADLQKVVGDKMKIPEMDFSGLLLNSTYTLHLKK